MKKGLLVVLMVFLPFLVLAAVRGDVNNSGQVDTLDYALIKNHVLGKKLLTKDQQNRADVDNDGKITLLDYVAVRKIILDNKSSIASNSKVIDVRPQNEQKNITCNDIKRIRLNMESVTLDVDETIRLHYVITDPDMTDPTITPPKCNYHWTSSDPSIAIVEDGVVKTKEEGTTIITLQVGETSARCNVRVKKPYYITEHLPSYYKDFEIWSREEAYRENNQDKRVRVYSDYSSDTLKYKIYYNKQDNNNYKYYRYALIWVENANEQIRNGNSDYNARTRIQHFRNEFNSKNKNEKKGMVGTNGGFFINGRDNIPINASKGKIEINKNYRTCMDDHSVKYTTLTVSKDNLLISQAIDKKYLINRGIYSGKETEYLSTDGYNVFKKWLEKNGAKNAWAVNYYTNTKWKSSESDDKSDWRTTLCQIDENNFVLAVGNNKIRDGQKELHDNFGCITTVNLDGGGSSGMFYKTDLEVIAEARVYYKPGEDQGTSKERRIADVLYFTEL